MTYYEEPWNNDRHALADRYENVTNPEQSNMFVRYLRSMMSSARTETSRERWSRIG